ncbi:hypothetical protein DTO271D3_3495 [Paecilomyces variotii]|nr:hypothetical protein DTO169C6_1267 [Paecilomyces variotii]KAJ9316226.1 hypothetical protein DTO271D3_3495 [Paecilomyces variotii]
MGGLAGRELASPDGNHVPQPGTSSGVRESRVCISLPSSIPFSFSFTITITTSQRQTCKEICKAGPSISTDGIFSGGPVLIFAQLITNHDTMRPVGLGVSNIQRPRCHAR